MDLNALKSRCQQDCIPFYGKSLICSFGLLAEFTFLCLQHQDLYFLSGYGQGDFVSHEVTIFFSFWPFPLHSKPAMLGLVSLTFVVVSFFQLIFKIQIEKVSTFLRTRGQTESIRWFRIFSPSPPIQVLTRPNPAQLPRSHEIGYIQGVLNQTFRISRSTALIVSRGSLLPCKVTQSQVPRDWSMNILGRILFSLPLMASSQEGNKKQIQVEAAKIPQLACQPATNTSFDLNEG